MTPINSYLRITLWFILCGLAISALVATLVPALAFAQTAPDDGPFADQNVIYLEADELVDDSENGILIAKGQVEGRYQNRQLRADEVIYTIKTGRLIASGQVVLIDENGLSQFADKLELSNSLEAGTAANFTARLNQKAQLGAKFVTRNNIDEGIELYNAYYTTCDICTKSGKPKRPTWRVRARKVKQIPKRNLIQYRDAVFELKGIPVFYTPFLSHPDPSGGRSSGLLIPYATLSGARGLGLHIPYYFVLSKSSELTLTPQLFQSVPPLVTADYRRLLSRGEININASLTYGSAFDNDGQGFTDSTRFTNPEQAPIGQSIRGHIYANALFALNPKWTVGVGVQLASDDLYLDGYGLNETPEKFGLYNATSRRLISQAFLQAQDKDFHLSVSSYGFQSLRSAIFTDSADPNLLTIQREDDDILPIIAPKIEIEKYFHEPLLNGRLKTYMDTTLLTRKTGTDYTRLTGGFDYNKAYILPLGIEARAFAGGRLDYYRLAAEDETPNSFSRLLGHIGTDIRWPFIRSRNDINIIIEPRLQITQNFGNPKLENFQTEDETLSLLQDSLDISLDQALLWAHNKSTGYDFWQTGLRADIGTALSADWAQNQAQIFVGQSYSLQRDNEFSTMSGLSGDSSDIVGLFELKLGRNLSTSTRLRYDHQDNIFRRIDTGFRYTHKWFNTNIRYYQINADTLISDPSVPQEEISGAITINILNNWRGRYRAAHDLSQNVTRSQTLSLIYHDDCTYVEFFYQNRQNNLGIIGNDARFGIRLAISTFGQPPNPY